MRFNTNCACVRVSPWVCLCLLKREEIAWKELLEAATGEGVRGISALVRTRKWRWKKYIWIKLNVYGVLLIMDHKFQSIIELGEKWEKGKEWEKYKALWSIRWGSTRVLGVLGMASIIMYKRQIDPDSSRFKEDTVTKDMRGMEGTGFSCYLRQADN